MTTFTLDDGKCKTSTDRATGVFNMVSVNLWKNAHIPLAALVLQLYSRDEDYGVLGVQVHCTKQLDEVTIAAVIPPCVF